MTVKNLYNSCCARRVGIESAYALIKMEDLLMFEKLKAILVEELSLNADDITLSAELVNDLGINSLELADLVLLCEDEFGIEFSEDDIHKFITVGDVVEFLEQQA